MTDSEIRDLWIEHVNTDPALHYWPEVLKFARAVEAARATPADHSVRDATLFDILMRRNIELTDEAYLSMRVVGVPPSEDEFVAALKKAIDAAIESQRSGNGESS